jgi:hypothetical protein
MSFMIENADAFRERAVQNRNRGYHTGIARDGRDFRRPDAAKGSWSYAVSVAKVSVSAAARFAQEEYRRAVFPERYDEVTLDDVIAANAAAADAALLATF